MWIVLLCWKLIGRGRLLLDVKTAINLPAFATISKEGR